MSTTKREFFPDGTAQLQAARLRPTSFLRAGVLALAAAVFAWPLTIPSGLLAAVLGALSGALAADALDRRAPGQIRLTTLLILAALALLGGLGVAGLIASTAVLARGLGPFVTLAVAEAVRFFFCVAPVVFALRVLARRRRTLAVLEVVAVGAAFVLAFAAHRDGMVHRPYAIGDWAWSRGIEPALILLLLGGFGTFLLAALLVQEERRRRLPLHFAGLLAVALILLVIVKVEGLPKPDPAGDLGLTEEESEGDQGGDEEAEPTEGGQGQGQDSESSDQLGDLQFRDEYSSSGQQAPVAVVLLHDDYSPPPAVYYLRQSAFSQYNGRRLVQATRDDVDRDLVERFPSRAVRLDTAPPLGAGRVPLKTTVALLVDHVRPFALDAPVALRPIPNPQPMRFRRAFEVLSHVPTRPYDELIGRRPGNAAWSDEQWEHYTEAPAEPRYRVLAERTLQLLRSEYEDDPLAQALAIKAFLDENGIYSRKSSHSGAEDPTASFLFGDLTGYCVHFAHAATYLMRSLGLPARVAAGYAIAESARGSGSTLMVRGADAHAWPELYLDGVGWVVIDPAPEQTLDEPLGEPDQRLQSMLGEMLRQEFDNGEFAQNPSPFDWRALLLRALMVFLALLAVAYAIKFYRALVPFVARASERHRLSYRAALDRLADVGQARRFGESRERFAARVRVLSPAFDELTRLHQRSALGPAETARREADAAGSTPLMIRVQNEIRGRVAAWRRVLGALDPISWWRAR